MKKLAGLILIFCGLAVPCLAQDEWQRATDLYKQGQYDDAIVLLDEAMATHPDWYYPVLLKGKCNLRLEKYEMALRNFTDALTLEVPTDQIPSVKYDMARANMSVGNFNQAIELFSELVSLVPPSKKFDLFYNRGQCELQIAKKNEAANDLNKAGNYYSKAIVSFGEAEKHKTTNKKFEVEASFQKAYSQFKIGNFSGSKNTLIKSLAFFEEVLRKDPRHQDSHRFLVDVSFRLTKKSASDVEKTKHYAKTVEYLDRYLEIWPKDDSMLNKKGQALQGQKRYKEAIDVFKRYVALKPSDGMGYFSLGSCQMAAKEYPAAIDSFRKALQRGAKSNHNTFIFTAYCYQQQKTGCYHKDIPLYEKAVDILSQGAKAIPSNGTIKKDLEAKRNNLQILRDNLATEEENRRTFLANIGELKKGIAINENKLARNREMHIAQPTAELDKAIKEGEVAIRDSKADLKKQLADLSVSFEEAKKCGGSAASKYYSQMAETLKELTN